MQVGAGTVSTTSSPGRITFHAAVDGSTGLTERMRIDSSGVQVAGLGVSSNVNTDGSGYFTTTSDETAKNIYGLVPYGLSEINGINPIMFNFKTDPDGCRPNMGFGARNIREVIPEAVYENSETGLLGLNERGILAAAINAIKELSAKVDSLQAQIDAKNSESN